MTKRISGTNESEEKECLCPTCGAKMVRYRHQLNEGLCLAMAEFFRRFQGNRGQVAEVKGLSHNQLANWQKLRYWGLIEKANEEGNEKGGWWRITGLGAEFLRGLGHNLRPTVMIGRDEISATVINALDEGLTAHELVKVKIQEGCLLDRHEAATQLAQAAGAAVGRALAQGR